ncbi:saccharopine dehydrogenase [Paracoccus sp. (in: a-proteobacteria)]|uniref:saccharopine dehydrogenase n=1 Tax=Paracoccus sp. TaxID=267 RepID=UPI00321F8E6B
MPHLWIRCESRENEARTALTPAGVAELRARGFAVTVEESPHRILPIADYAAAGAAIARRDSWPDAPTEAIILGIKELPGDAGALRHRHIMFGHAYKGQPAGRALLRRFRQGGGRLYDLEYLTNDHGRRLAAFGYWAGYAGAAVALRAWAAQQRGGICGPVQQWPDREQLLTGLRADLARAALPRTIVVGALGRVGSGASDLLAALGVPVTRWDMAETAGGGPYPEILAHDLFVNCILAGPQTPVLLPPEAAGPERRLRVVGDVACDPGSDFNPIRLYGRVTDWARPAIRVAVQPPLDIIAIDNLPSLLPRESSLDFAAQLLPWLLQLGQIDSGAWARAAAEFDRHIGHA